MNQEYKKLKCYTDMTETYRLQFDEMVKDYGEELNKGVKMGKAVYTLHDFDHHCYNIMKIVSEIFNFKDVNALELYILNLSILFHDISMTRLDFDRGSHSLQSKQFILAEYARGESSFAIKSELGQNQVDILANIIEAHSDIKAEDNNGVGLDNKDLNNTFDENINAKFLATMLRLADELDITNNRINNRKLINELEKYVESGKATADAEESLKHWKRLEFFTHINRKKDDNACLVVHCSKNVIGEYENRGDNQNWIADIRKIKNKILLELKKCNYVFDSMMTDKFFKTINKISISTGNKELDDLLASEDGCMEVIKVNGEQTLSETTGQSSSEQHIEDIITNGPSKMLGKSKSGFSNIIDEFINRRKLLQGGHRILNAKYCTRDWIDTREILETQDISEQCVDAMAWECAYKYRENCILVGLDYEGAQLASRVALKTKMPFTYIIPAISHDTSTEQDNKNFVPTDSNVVLFTDVIATFETIKSAIQEYGFKGRVEGIYTILYRKAIIEMEKDEMIDKLMEKTYYMSDSFEIEVFEREKCIHKCKQ